MNKNIFKQFNLNDKEGEIYLASLELGEATAQIIAQKAGITRTYFYDIAEKLISSGLMNQSFKGKKRYFSATQPKRLIEIQEARLKELKEIMPELNAITNTKGKKPKIMYFEGQKGIDLINADTLRNRGEIVGFTTPSFLTFNNRTLSQDYIKKRVALGNKVRVIGGMSQELLALKKKDAEELRETRLLPNDLFSSEIEIGLYGGKVFVINYKSEFGFIIEDSETNRVLKMIFELIWNSGRVVE